MVLPLQSLPPFLRIAPSPTLLGSTCLQSNASSHSPRQCCRSHWFRSIIVLALADYYSTLGAPRSASNKEIKRNMDEAVEKLKKKGIEATGIVCHVSNPQQRKKLIDKTIQFGLQAYDTTPSFPFGTQAREYEQGSTPEWLHM